MSKKKLPEPGVLLPDQCPVCGATNMYRIGDSLFCPAEDPHPGGVVIRSDGLTRMGLAPRSTMATSPKEGVAGP